MNVFAANAPKCYSASDVKNSVCWALCRQDGNDTGMYDEPHDECLCANRKKYKEATEQAIKISSSMQVKVLVAEKKSPTNYFYPTWGEGTD